LDSSVLKVSGDGTQDVQTVRFLESNN